MKAVLTLYFLSIICCDGVTIPNTQYQALARIYSLTGGKNWHWQTGPTAKAKWNFSSNSSYPCTWQGLSCDCCSITKINLASYGLVGTLPPEIGGLVTLQSLVMSKNSLRGTIPDTLSLLTALQVLDISSNKLSTQLPSALTKLSKLNALNLYTNKIFGTIPSSIGVLTQLTALDLSSNSLAGTMPKEIFLLPKLKLLNLYSNLLTGRIPKEIGKCINAQNISLYLNMLNGSIPTTIGDISALLYLRLYSNSLTGPIPSQLAYPTKLTYLSFYQNSLSGTIPSSLGIRTDLIYLGLYSNLLTGTIPSSLGALHNMQYLRLYNNSLTGTVPPELNGMTASVLIRVNNNTLTGTLPPLGQLPFLQYLDFQFNAMSGTIPSLYGNMSALRYLYLHNNYFRGTIPSTLSSLSVLQYLRLNDNQLSGSLPSQLSELTNLQVLLVQNNRLNGLPGPAFSAAKQHKLTNIDLSQNGFIGPLPVEPFKLNSLLTFGASKNCFSGELPVEICAARSLQILAMNGLRGGASCSVKVDFGVAQSSEFSKSMTGEVPACIWEMANLTSIGLSGNGLAGKVRPPTPNSALRYLYLSGNRISGTIPVEFQMWHFNDLDLSNNKIKGTWTEVSPYFQPNSTKIKFNINRISGDLPPQFKYAAHVDILDGNTFTCGDTLPDHDPSYKSYVCGSSGLDNSLFFILESFAFSVVMTVGLLIYLLWIKDGFVEGADESLVPDLSPGGPQSSVVKYTRTHRMVLIYWRLLQRWARGMRDFKAEKCYSKIPNLYGFMDFLREIRIVAALLGAVVFLVCLPLYPAMKQYINHGNSNTQTRQYNWYMSVVFLSGLTPSLVLLLLWNAMASVLVLGLMLNYRRQSKLQQSYGVHDALGNKRERDRPLPSLLPVKVSVWSTMRRTIIISMLTVVTLTIIFIQNGIFVAIQQSKSSSSLKATVQFLNAIFSATVSVSIRAVMRMLTDNHSEAILVNLLLSLASSVFAPVLTVLVLDRSCFNQIFVAFPDVETVYYFNACLFFTFNTDTQILSCLTFGPLGPLISTYTPSFIYNNRCSTSLLIKYIPTFIYGYSFSTFVSPWLTLIIPSFLNIPGTIGRQNFYYIIYPDKKSSGIYLFDGGVVIINLITSTIVLLTFGLASPPLAGIVICSIIVQTFVWQIIIGRYIERRKAKKKYAEEMEGVTDDDISHGLEECCHECWKAPVYCLFVVVLGSCLFQGVLLLDLVDDSTSLRSAFWPTVVLAIAATCLHVGKMVVERVEKRRFGKGPIPRINSIELANQSMKKLQDHVDPKSGPVFSELRGGAEEPLDVVTTIAPPEAKGWM